MADVLFVGAHPDDMEILAGGTVGRMAAAGHDVMIADATEGEMGSRGTVAERYEEAANAAKILGVRRTNLQLPDGKLMHNMELVIDAFVRLIRAEKPKLVFTHEANDHHPDHHAVSTAMKFAHFQSNVVKYDTGQERHRAERLLYTVSSRQRIAQDPSFVVDVTESFDRKLEALKAYKSQLANPDYKGPETYVSSQLVWDFLIAQAGYWGGVIKVKYGEAFVANEPLQINDPMSLIPS